LIGSQDHAGSLAAVVCPGHTRVIARVLPFVLVLGVAGCRRSPAPFVLPPAARAPAMLESWASPAPPPMLEEVVPPPPPPLTAVERKIAPPRKPVATEPPPAVQVAGVDPGAAAIGALSAGGDSSPQSQQDAKDLIASIERRLSALTLRKLSEQRTQIRKVRRFLDQAQQALTSGDAEGAKTLAVKAKLLMDDVEK
jgi:hypothetical protein